MGNSSFSLGSAADTATSTANAAVSITYEAIAQYGHAIDGIAYSFSETATAELSVAIAGTKVFSMDVSGSGVIPYRVRSPAGSAMVIALAAGGGSAIGKINVLGKQTV